MGESDSTDSPTSSVPTAVFWQQDSHLHSDNTDIDNADLSLNGCNHPHPYSYHRDNTHIPRHKYNKCRFHNWFLTLYSIFLSISRPLQDACSIAFCYCSFCMRLATLFLVSYHVFIDCVHFCSSNFLHPILHILT